LLHSVIIFHHFYSFLIYITWKETVLALFVITEGHTNKLLTKVIETEERQDYMHGQRKCHRCLLERQKRSVSSHQHVWTPSFGSLYGKEGNASKPLCIEIYNMNMGFVDTSNKVANRYSTFCKICKWTKKLFFHLVNLSILNAFIIHSSCGGTLTHKVFWEKLVGDLIYAVQDINPSPST
jgi:hypothetical protein